MENAKQGLSVKEEADAENCSHLAVCGLSHWLWAFNSCKPYLLLH